MLAGRPPHRGETPNALVSDVLRSNPPMPTDAPQELAELALRCFARKPEDRPESALAVRRQLEAFIEHQGSLALATQSERRAEELRALLATTAPDSTRVYSLFSECRFGFQQALSAWGRNTRARAGLEDALKTMARFELQQGSVKAARALLNELSSPDPVLEAELQVVAKREEQKVLELARLQGLEKTLDPLTGSLSRMVVSILVGAIWVISPFFGRMQLEMYPGTEMIATAPLALLSAVVMMVIAIRSKRARTVLNRQLLSIVVFGMLTQAAFVSIHYRAGGDLGPLSIPVLSGYWFVISGVITVTFLPSAWPMTVGYLSSAIGALIYPDYRYEFAAAGNLVLCIAAFHIFRSERRREQARDALLQR